ncbi:hypothetical protein HanRHA438_Chr09g0402851 [Helianthus annuus]|nr:hypothetical protein HanIR_Chr09g0421971 [Helianthus annuus]KAJ0888518.1 hypothetical protein HanRHA438_Chr09g0402851 [Helianthus annuus]
MIESLQPRISTATTSIVTGRINSQIRFIPAIFNMEPIIEVGTHLQFHLPTLRSSMRVSLLCLLRFVTVVPSY